MHPELSANHVSQSVAHVGPSRIGFIDLLEGIAIAILFPMDPLEILNQLRTLRIDEQGPDSGLTTQLCVHAVHTVPHLGVRRPDLKRGLETVRVAPHEILWQQSDNVPFEQSRNVPLTTPRLGDGRGTAIDETR